MPFVLAFIATILTAWLLGKFLFGSFSVLVESAEFWVTPDIVSIFMGEYEKDLLAEFKFWVWLGGSFGAGYIVLSLCT